MAERGCTWGDSETAKLLELWSEEGIQAQLRGMTRNEVPYRQIAEGLEKARYKRTFTQCREKIKALKKHKEVVGLLILKFSFHSASSQPDTTLQKNIRLLGLAHIILF